MIAMGYSQADAYRKAINPDAEENALWANASRLAASDRVRIRVAQLHEAVRIKADAKVVYRYQDAMRDSEEIQRLALLDSDYGAAMTAVRHKSRISGLEVDPRKNSRSPFADMTDEQLDEHIKRAETEVKRAGKGLH